MKFGAIDAQKRRQKKIVPIRITGGNAATAAESSTTCNNHTTDSASSQHGPPPVAVHVASADIRDASVIGTRSSCPRRYTHRHTRVAVERSRVFRGPNETRSSPPPPLQRPHHIVPTAPTGSQTCENVGKRRGYGIWREFVEKRWPERDVGGRRDRAHSSCDRRREVDSVASTPDADWRKSRWHSIAWRTARDGDAGRLRARAPTPPRARAPPAPQKTLRRRRNAGNATALGGPSSTPRVNY